MGIPVGPMEIPWDCLQMRDSCYEKKFHSAIAMCCQWVVTTCNIADVVHVVKYLLAIQHNTLISLVSQCVKIEQESLADARVTWDSSAYMKAIGNKSKLSWKPYPGTKHYLDGHFCISKMAFSRHLGFLSFESCTIRSADRENPTLEPNITSIGKPVAKLWPYLDIKDGHQLLEKSDRRA